MPCSCSANINTPSGSDMNQYKMVLEAAGQSSDVILRDYVISSKQLTACDTSPAMYGTAVHLQTGRLFI